MFVRSVFDIFRSQFMRPLNRRMRRASNRRFGAGQLQGLESLEVRRLLTFNLAVNYAVGSGPQAVVTADFNGDGRQDVATASSSSTVSVLLGNVDGTFQAAPNSPCGNYPLSVAVGDFNADGKLDLATASAVDVSVLLGNGNGTFQAPANIGFSDGSSPSSVAVGDFNGDGKLDLGVTSNLYVFEGCGYSCYMHEEARANVLLGTGTGSFAAPIAFYLGYGSHYSAAVADFNGDGKQDFASANLSSVNVLLGTGTGTFGAQFVFGTGNHSRSVAAGDVNADGDIDLVTANLYGANVSVLLGNGLGSFGAAQNYGAGSQPNSVAMADFNGDSNIDLVTANNGDSGTISVLLGTGTGAFKLPVNAAAGAGPLGVAVGDFNGDGRIDAASANLSSSNVSVLLNDGIWPALDAPSITINDVSVTEGNTGTTAATFTVSLSAAYNQTVTVNYATADGSAVGGSDYQVRSGTLTFSAGQTSKTITVLVNGDRTGEYDESFYLNLTSGTNAFMADASGVGGIVRDEPFLNIDGEVIGTEGEVIGTEGNTGTTAFRVTVTLSAASDAPVTVNYATSDLTNDWISYGYVSATADVDYQAATGTLTVPAGETSKSFTLFAIGDRLYESYEYFLINLSNANGALLGSSQVLGSIMDDEPKIRLDGGSVVEGNSGTKALSFTASLSSPYDLPVTVNYTTADGSALAGTDYITASGTLTFAAGQTSLPILVTVKGDLLMETDELFSMQLSDATIAAIDYGFGYGTIIDDDTPPSISIYGDGVYEGNSGTKLLTFTVGLSQVSSKTVKVDYATANGTARTSDRDYVAKSGTLTFAPGETTKTISVVVNGDRKKEKNEYFYVKLSRPINGTLSTSQATGSIWNDDGVRAGSSRMSFSGGLDQIFEDLLTQKSKKRRR